MKLVWLVMGATLMLVLSVALAMDIPSVTTLFTNATPQQRIRSSPPLQLLYTNSFAGSTSTFGLPRFRFNPPGARGKPLTSKLPAPGVYKTEPYACIVLVPGAHPDDKMAVGVTDRASPMPMIQPELRFIPWPSKDQPAILP